MTLTRLIVNIMRNTTDETDDELLSSMIKEINIEFKP